MASEMKAFQHSCERLLRFLLPANMVTVDMKVMTLLGVHIFKQDKHISGKSFIPWSKENMPLPVFLKELGRHKELKGIFRRNFRLTWSLTLGPKTLVDAPK